jgi:hypothetical protein
MPRLSGMPSQTSLELWRLAIRQEATPITRPIFEASDAITASLEQGDLDVTAQMGSLAGIMAAAIKAHPNHPDAALVGKKAVEIMGEGKPPSAYNVARFQCAAESLADILHHSSRDGVVDAHAHILLP